MQDLAWSVEMKDGETFTCNEGKATYEYEVVGDDAVYTMEEGEENLEDE